MKSVSHNKSWCADAEQIHVEPPTKPPIKSKIYFKKERDYVKIKLRRNPTSEKLDMYEFKMDLFENVNRE